MDLTIPSWGPGLQEFDFDNENTPHTKITSKQSKPERIKKLHTYEFIFTDYIYIYKYK